MPIDPIAIANFQKIKRFVVLMLENRSFDHLFGYLKNLVPAIAGLTGKESNQKDPNTPGDPPVPVRRATTFVMTFDPAHEFYDVQVQLYGPLPGTDPSLSLLANIPADPAPMTGFIANACHAVDFRKLLFGRGSVCCLAILLLAGCRSIPSADVQAFSTGVSAARSQTDTALLAVTDLTTDSIIDYAASQATLTEANFLPVLDPAAIAVWDNVFSALEKYSQSLVLLTSPNLTSDYESAAVNLADQIKQTGSKLESQKLAGSAPAVPPSFAAAFTELGEILLRAKAQHDAIRIASQTEPKIRSILSVMADTIGATRNEGLRGTVHANWDQRKAAQQVAFLDSKVSTARRAIAVQ